MIDKNKILSEFSFFINMRFFNQKEKIITNFFKNINAKYGIICNCIYFNGKLFSSVSLVDKEGKLIYLSYDYFEEYNNFYPIYIKFNEFDYECSFLNYCFNIICAEATKRNLDIYSCLPKAWVKNIFNVDSKNNSNQYKEFLYSLSEEDKNKFTNLIEHLITLDLIVND